MFPFGLVSNPKEEFPANSLVVDSPPVAKPVFVSTTSSSVVCSPSPVEFNAIVQPISAPKEILGAKKYSTPAKPPTAKPKVAKKEA